MPGVLRPEKEGKRRKEARQDPAFGKATHSLERRKTEDAGTL